MTDISSPPFDGEWIARCREEGRRAIFALLEECGLQDPADERWGASRAQEGAVDTPEDMLRGTGLVSTLDGLAAEIIEAMLGLEHGTPRGIASSGPLEGLPDFPIGLSQRVLAALHLLDATEECRWASMLAGLSARHLLLDGEVTSALEMSVLAIGIAARTGAPDGPLAVGVAAAALSRAPFGQESAAELRAAIPSVAGRPGSTAEEWRDAHAWDEVGPWTDGARFAPALSHPTLFPERPPLLRTELLWEPGSPMDPCTSMGTWARFERFGMNTFCRRTRMHPIVAWAMVHDLEDQAIQDELEFV